MSSSGLVLPLAASARAGHETSYVPRPEDSRLTWPAPSKSEPSQWVFDVRGVAMWFSFVGGEGVRTEPCRVVDNGQVTTPTPETDGQQAETFYDAIGGYPTIAKIVARFYAGVAEDEVLRPLYPEADLGPAEERFRLFLVQYWGGPSTYNDLRGHPRLRMWHAP